MNFRASWIMRTETVTLVSIIAILVLCVNNAYAGLNDDLFKAIKQGDLNQGKQLIIKGAEVNVKNKGGVPALRAAISLHDPYGRTISLEYEKRSPLEPNLGIIQALLVAEADVNARDKSGVTPLMAASNHGHQKIVEQLIKAGAHY